MSENKLSKDQLVSALQLLLDELDPKEKEINLRDPKTDVLKFDKGYIANSQIENRGHWIEYMIGHRDSIVNNICYERAAAAELDICKPLQWSHWYTPVKPEVSIFQVLNELTEKKVVLEIDYTISLNGAYQTYYEEKNIRCQKYLDFGKIDWKNRLDKTMDDFNSWINCHLETVDNWERSDIHNYMSRYILGFIGYLADASKYNKLQTSEPKSNSHLCLVHMLDTKGVYAKKKPKRSVSITIHAVRAYEPLPEDIDIDVANINALMLISNKFHIQYAILETIAQYRYGHFVPHEQLQNDNRKVGQI